MFVFQALLDVMMSNITIVISKSGIVSLRPVLMLLLAAVSSSQLEDEGGCWIAVCRTIIPMTLVKFLLGEVSDKVLVATYCFQEL